MPNICERGPSRTGAAYGGELFDIKPRSTPPSETVRVAAIGAGGRAVSNIEGLAGAGAKIVALCDVDERRSADMRKKYAHVPFFKDYRMMLDQLDKEIDAVMVGTPDHLHAAQAIECLKRGKHVQCEKPLGQSFEDVDRMVAAAKATNLVNQAMNQGHAYDTIRDFREWVEADLIGDVTEAHIWCPAQYSFMDSLDEMAKSYDVPDGLDWNLWQGPVPHRPFFPKFVPGVWRFWTMYGSSTIGDWSCHLMDPLFWTFGLRLPDAVTVTPCGCDWDPVMHGLTFPKGMKTVFEFRKRDGGPFKLFWYDGLACADVLVPDKYPLPGDAAARRYWFPPTMSAEVVKYKRDGMANGALVYGTTGVIEYGHHGANYLRILPDMDKRALAAAGTLPAEKYPRVPGGCPYKEFIAAMKGGPEVGSDFDYAGVMSQASSLAVAALFEPGKRLVWDHARREFANSSVATARLRQPRTGNW